MDIFKYVKERKAQVRNAKLEKSKQNIEQMRAELKETRARNAVISEESNLKEKLAKARGPSKASQIIGKVQEKLKAAKKSGLFTDTEGDNNPFKQSSGPSSGFISGLSTGGSNPFYAPEPKRRKKR